MKNNTLQFLTLIFLTLIFGKFSAVQAQSPQVKLPDSVNNSIEDSSVNSEVLLRFTLSQEGNLYYKETLINQKLIKKTLKQHFDTYSPLYKQAYIKGDVDTKIGKLLELSKSLYKSEEIDDIRLVVIPTRNVREISKDSKKGFTLNLRITSKEIERKLAAEERKAAQEIGNYDEPPSGGGTGRGTGRDESSETPVKIEPPKKPFKATRLNVTQNSNRKLSLNGVTLSAEDLLIAVEKEFKERTANGIYRIYTNEIDKSVYIKVSTNLELKHLIGLIDNLYGAGAVRVYLKIDEIAK
jgi:biopolymer transport protein ExbD